PTQVVLEFVEPLNPDYTTIVVTDANERPVPASEPIVSGKRGTVTFPRPLTDGTYTVAYRVVSADGHPVQGSYPFTVATGGGSSPTTPADQPTQAVEQAADTATPTVSPAPVSVEDDSGTGTTTVAAVVVGLLVLIGGGF